MAILRKLKIYWSYGKLEILQRNLAVPGGVPLEEAGVNRSFTLHNMYFVHYNIFTHAGQKN